MSELVTDEDAIPMPRSDEHPGGVVASPDVPLASRAGAGRARSARLHHRRPDGRPRPERTVDAMRRLQLAAARPRLRGRRPLPRRRPLLRPGRGVPGRLAGRAPGPRRRGRSAPSGATATSGAGGWTPRCTRSRTTRWPRSRGSSRERALLGDRLDVYHVHSATLDTGVLDDTALHRALARLRDAGVRVGVSTSGPDRPPRSAGRWP